MTLIACTRPSTLAGAMEDKGGLMPYVAASTLKTVSEHPDLMTRLQLTKGDSWRDFKPLYEEADTRGGGREASAGTNIHMVVKALADEATFDLSVIPEPTRSDGQAVYDAIHERGFTIVASEVFLVTIDPRLPEACAGTADLILRAEDGTHFIGDTKSVGAHGDTKYAGMKWGIQTGVYAHGKPYPHPYARDQWGRPKIDPAKVGEWGFEIDTTRAAVFAVERGAADVRVHWLDLDLGYRLAAAACHVRAARKRGFDVVLGESEAPEWTL